MAGIICAIALLAPFLDIARAQTPNASQISGTVTDRTGGVIVDAVVTLAAAAALPRTVATDRQGRFRFERVPAGSYTLIVDAPNFLKHQSAIAVGRDSGIVRDVSLDVGVSISVDVLEPAGLSLESRRNLSSIRLTRKDIDTLPDDPRLFMRRLLEMAGSTGARGDVAIYVDGFRNYQRLPPKSVIDTIRINSNPFSAEFAQQSVRRLEITTRPGSDGFHGDVTAQARSNRLNARNPLADTKPKGEYRNFNGYLQGPVRKGRVGFLLYGGQWRQDDNANVHATVLDSSSRSAIPLATLVQTPTTVSSGELKLDFRVFNQVVNMSYGRTDEAHRGQGLESGFDLPERAYERRSRDDVGRLWWTALGRQSINDFRVEFATNTASRAALSKAPTVLVLDAFNAGGNEYAASRSTSTTLQAAETLTLARGRHTWKAGVQFETLDEHTIDRTEFGGVFTFGVDVDRDSFGQPILNAAGQGTAIAPIEAYRRTLLGLPGYGPSQFVIAGGNPEVEVTQWNGAWFVLDDWAISKRVSLSYGLRQELQNNVALRVNLAPRVAMSWLLDAKGKNILKLGGGVFYTRVDPQLTLDTRKMDGIRRTQIIVQQPSFFTDIPPTFTTGRAVHSAAYTMAEAARMPYAAVTTVNYERELPHGLFAGAQYLFAQGFDQLRLRNTTAASGSSISSTAPIFQFESTGRSLQHELMLIARGDVGVMLSFYGNYRLGRKTSDTDGPRTLPARSHDLSAEYGPAASDRLHQISAGLTVTMPGEMRMTPSLTLASGRPFNILTGRDNDGDTVFTDRPAFADAGDPGAVVTPFGSFNPNPRPGDAIIPRNFGREPWQTNLDLAVSRTVKGVTVTADAENVLNTRRFFALNSVLTSPVFGQPNQALSARRLELTVRYGF